MKYYIPTSNINLDNILQSECILPPTHYNQRISGYNSFEQIEQLRSFSSIILFDYPVHFTINDTYGLDGAYMYSYGKHYGFKIGKFYASNSDENYGPLG